MSFDIAYMKINKTFAFEFRILKNKKLENYFSEKIFIFSVGNNDFLAYFVFLYYAWKALEKDHQSSKNRVKN